MCEFKEKRRSWSNSAFLSQEAGGFLATETFHYSNGWLLNLHYNTPIFSCEMLALDKHRLTERNWGRQSLLGSPGSC